MQEPPEKIAQKMKLADTSLLVTTYSLSHTQARKKANKAGTRIISLQNYSRNDFKNFIG